MLQPRNNLVKKNEVKRQALFDSIKQLNDLVNLLELSFFESQRNDRLLLMSLRVDTIKENSLKSRLKETNIENKELLNVVQLRDKGTSFKSCGSNISLAGSSISTMSLVNLQYKYEELLASHNGLLKILELRNNDLKKYTDENCVLNQKVDESSAELKHLEVVVDSLKRKIQEVKSRKKKKIFRLVSERDTLALVHDRLVGLLHRQCLQKNRSIDSQLKDTNLGVNGLLLREAKKNNILSYENFQMQQEIEYLRTFLEISKNSSKSHSECSEKLQMSRKSSKKTF